MVKSKRQFEKVRELRDLGRTGTKIAKEIGVSKEMVYLIFSAIKNNFDSLSEHHNYIINKIINPETGKSFSDPKEYHGYIARKKGFRNNSDYVKFRKLEREDNEYRLSEQEIFERSIQLSPIEEFEEILFEDDYYKNLENGENIELLLNKLPDRYKCVLKMRYLEEKTQEETGSLLGITHQRVQKLEKRAWEYFHSKNKIETHNKFEEGELLLVYILSKFLKNKNRYNLKEILNLTNKIYHNNKEIRTRNVINYVLCSKFCKKKLNNLKNKYFPLG